MMGASCLGAPAMRGVLRIWAVNADGAGKRMTLARFLTGDRLALEVDVDFGCRLGLRALND